MSRSERRAARIREEVPIGMLLSHYGYEVSGGEDRQQQFRCDLHGDGNDGKPSARCYPESNTWHCWACNTNRDAIQTVREKEGLGFVQCMDRLEALFHLPPLPWEEGDWDHGKDLLSGAFDAPRPTYEGESHRVTSLLSAMCRERSLPLAKVLMFTEEHDYVDHTHEEGDAAAFDAMIDLRRRILDHQRSNL